MGYGAGQAVAGAGQYAGAVLRDQAHQVALAAWNRGVRMAQLAQDYARQNNLNDAERTMLIQDAQENDRYAQQQFALQDAQQPLQLMDAPRSVLPRGRAASIAQEAEEAAAGGGGVAPRPEAPEHVKLEHIRSAITSLPAGLKGATAQLKSLASLANTFLPAQERINVGGDGGGRLKNDVILAALNRIIDRYDF
jgi:hypothetical protein